MSVTFENIGNFSVKEVQKWSLRHGLDEYGIPEILKKNDIDGSLLVKLNEETMKSKLNISSFGARHKLITLIKNSTKAQSQARNHSLTIRDFGVGQYLAQIPLLENLSESDRARIGANLSSVNFNSKDVIVKQGQRQLNFYIIREGVARVRVRDSVSGRTRLIARLHPGDFFGEEGLVHQQRAPATIISETAIEVWVVNIKFCRGVLRKSKILKNIPHRMGISAKDPESVTTKAPQNVVRQKSNKAKNLLVETLRKNCIFDHVGKDQIDACVDLMWRIETKKGQLLIKQGDHGDFFYVIESGHFDVLVTDENGFTITAAERGPGASFGELALMYDAARAATVKATEDGVVWVLDRQNFRRILLFSNAKEMQLREKMLRNTTILKYLLPNEISVLASALQAKHFSKGTEIFLQGDKGDSFMIVESGTVSVIKDDKEVNKLSEGKFFGEIALLTGEPRQATVRAFSDDVVCLFLGTNEFKQLLGPIHQLMERNIDKYSEKPVSSPIKAPSSADTDEIVKPRNTSFLENTTSQDLKSITILGSGAFGEVRLVEIDNSDETFALKKVSKSKIASSGQVSHILNERSLMMMMQSPFIVKLYKTFESDKSIYFLMEVCLGGELFTYIRDCGSMEEQDAQFYAGCVVLGFEHMHRQNIIYRDLKPENLMIDGEGYLKITDFGFAKKIKNRTFTLCGTPDYLAPEVINGKGHSFGVDWWTLGILTFELLHSFPPFYDTNHMKTYSRIIRESIKFPSSFSSNAKLFIAGLTQKKFSQRLGVVKGGVERIKSHKWYDGFDWEKLAARKLTPPIIPTVKNGLDTSNFDNYPDKSKNRLSKFAAGDFSSLGKLKCKRKK